MPAPKVKHGMTVELADSGKWTVLDRHPKAGHWWLHRWVGDQWETTYAKQRDLLL